MRTLRPLMLAAVVALAPALGFAQAPAATPGASNAVPAKDKSVRKAQRQARFQAADTNGDGAISKAEADAAGMRGLSRRFDRIDANKDGRVTRDEIKAARQARKGQRGTPRAGGTTPPAPR